MGHVPRGRSRSAQRVGVGRLRRKRDIRALQISYLENWLLRCVSSLQFRFCLTVCEYVSCSKCTESAVCH